MAVYGSQIEAGKSEQEALDAVATVLEKTSVLDDSARDSLQTFASGKGDVLIGYENEAIQAKDEGIELDYVIPDDDQDREPRRRHDRGPGSRAREAFLDFILTDGAADLRRLRVPPGDRVRAAAEHGQVPGVSGLFTIADFGGWARSTTSSSTTRPARSEILRPGRAAR